MTAIARRLDPCLNWFKLLARTKGRILWIFPIVLFGAYLGSVSRESYPLSDFFEVHSQRRASSPLLAEALRLNLNYEEVSANPQAYVGKPVAWCVDTPGGTTASSYVSGRPAWPVALSGLENGYYTSTRHCADMLAVIDGVKNGQIQLRFVQRR